MKSSAASARSAGWPGWLLVPGAAAVTLLLWRLFCTIERVQWNAPRLTASFALVRGLNIYGTRTEGPFLGWVYGPVFPLYLTPAALAPNLDAAFALAWLLNLAAFVGSAWFVARTAFPVGGRPVAAALFFWGALCLAGEISQTQFYFLHVDPLCVGLTLLAAGAIARAAGEPSAPGWLILAAIATGLAIWTKQLAVATPLILAAWLFAEGQRKGAARYLALTMMVAGVLAVVFLNWFGAERLLFNLVWVHLRNPYRPDGQAAFFGQLLRSIPVWIAVGLALLAWRVAPATPVPAPWQRVRSLLLWLAIGSLPLGLIAAAKVAGGWNSLHSLNYALLLLALLLAEQAVQPEGSPAVRRAIAAVTVLLLAAGWWLADRADLAWRPDHSQTEALANARQHPGRVYYPWNPLVTLVTDGRIYPFDDALVCLSRQGLTAPISAVRREIPPEALVIYPDPVQSQYALEYLAGAVKPPTSEPKR